MQILPFKEGCELFDALHPVDVIKLLDKRNLEILSNTDKEILEIVQEMEALVSGVPLEKSPEDVLLQQQFWKLFSKNSRGFSMNQFNHVIRIGRDFLKNHSHLLI